LALNNTYTNLLLNTCGIVMCSTGIFCIHIEHRLENFNAVEFAKNAYIF